MPATRASVAEILQDFYFDTVTEELNQEALIYNTFEKMTVTWSGQQAVLLLHVSRNDGVGVAADGTTFTFAPGQQGHARLNVTAANVYGLGQITGPTIASANSDAASFVNALDNEMEGIVMDVKNRMNRFAVSGERVKGFLSERKASGFTAGPQTQAGFLAAPPAEGTFDEFVYDGDLTEFVNVVQAGPHTTYVRVELFRTDTLQPVTLINAPANPNFFVTNVPPPIGSAAPGTLEIGFGDDAVGSGWTSADILIPNGVIVALSAMQGVDNAGADLGQIPRTGGGGWTNEPMGIFGNLFDPDNWHGLNRSLAANAVLRSNFVTMNPALAGTRVPLTLLRLQQVFDTISLASDEEPDFITTNHLQRQHYVGLLQGFLTGDATKATTGDGGMSSFSYKGIPLKVSKDVSNGMWIFLKKKHWKLLELQAGGFADLDGNILSRAENSDAWNFFWRAYYNVGCKRPNANAILSGIDLIAV